jgi:hypothetical protein
MATAKASGGKVKRERGVDAGVLVNAAAQILRQHGPMNRARLEHLVREAGWSFQSSRFALALERYGEAHGLEGSGKRAKTWRVKLEPSGYGPDLAPADAPRGRRLPLLRGVQIPVSSPPPRVTIPDNPEAIEFSLLPAVRPEEFPHPDREEPPAEVQPIAGVSFPGAHRLGTWRVLHPIPGRDVIEVYPPQGEPLKVALSTAETLADALRAVTVQAASRLREAQSAGG